MEKIKRVKLSQFQLIKLKGLVVKKIVFILSVYIPIQCGDPIMWKNRKISKKK